MTTTSSSLDSESLVARIIAELQADPDAQSLLLRALLTNEFLGMPIRLERIEADVAELKREGQSLGSVDSNGVACPASSTAPTSPRSRSLSVV